jgi:DNA-binding MarR family transcriptional regulator
VSDFRRAAALRLAVKRFQSATQGVVRGCGLTAMQYLLLLVIAGTDPRDRLTRSQLAAALEVAPSTFSELLDRAERAGLVARVVAEHDARVSYVEATDKGHRCLMQAFTELRDEREALVSAALRAEQ